MKQCVQSGLREMRNALDGGFAVIGHLDRILISYYERDLKNNRITPDEAQELVDCFVSMTDARWILKQIHTGGTNADIIIRCDKWQYVYNDISRMIYGA
ncbi:MAG: pyruvate formate lyase family protein [Enterocloster sp.]